MITDTQPLISLKRERESLQVLVSDLRMKPPSRWKFLLKEYGYSEKTIREIWKWYDFSEKRGIASF